MGRKGDEKLSGKVAVDCEWLSVEPSTFDNAPATIKCTVDTEKMRPGVDESCIISITSNGGDATIGVKARTHMLPPLLNVEPAELNFGENLDQIITFEVKNLGESVISGTAKSAQSWLSITPEEFGGDTNINVSINKAEIPKFEEPGKHTIEGTIVVETNGGLIEIKVKAIVVVEKQPIVIELMVGTPFAVVDGKTKLLQAPPMIVSGRTLVPLRFVAETFGGQVLWDQTTRTTTLKFESKKVEISLRSGEATQFVQTGARDYYSARAHRHLHRRCAANSAEERTPRWTWLPAGRRWPPTWRRRRSSSCRYRTRPPGRCATTRPSPSRPLTLSSPTSATAPSTTSGGRCWNTWTPLSSG